MAERLLGALYRRTGPRYPLTVLVLAIAIQFAVFALMIAVITLYVPTSLGQYVVLILAAAVLQAVFTATSVGYFAGRLSPTIAWLRGERGAGLAEGAWKAAASLPVDFFRRQVRKLAPLIYNLIWCSFAVWELGLPGYGLAILVAVGAPVFLFAISVLFLLLERSLRPLLDELSVGVPPEVELVGAGIPLRVRLLATLPGMNIVAGVTVAGLADAGNGTVARLGLVVAVSFGISLALALVLALLLSDSVVAPVTRLCDATERVGSGDLTVEVAVISTDETGQLTGSFNRMVHGLRERERLRDAFGAFVDPGLTDRVLRDGTDLAGEEVELSVLFMDVRDFTRLSERAEAREVVAMLNDLYGQVVPVILDHGGHANKFIGDGLLAVFGAPERLTDHADRAVAAAIDIAELVRARYNGQLRVGIGVNSGRVVVGTIGGGGRLDFTVIGDPVNTAARVETATRETDDDILVTSATLARSNSRQCSGTSDFRSRSKARANPSTCTRQRRPARPHPPPGGHSCSQRSGPAATG